MQFLLLVRILVFGIWSFLNNVMHLRQTDLSRIKKIVTAPLLKRSAIGVSVTGPRR